MRETRLIMESWRGFLNEELEPGNIFTIGELMQYFKRIEPSKLKKLAGKYGSAVVKALTVGAGLAASAATSGIAAGTAAAGAGLAQAVGGEVLEKMLMAAVIAFANIPDESYSADDGSAASFFDIDDTITIFLRNVETQEKNILNPSIPEREAFEEMRNIVSQVAGAIPEDGWAKTRLSDVLNTTTQKVLDANLLQRDKVKVQSS